MIPLLLRQQYRVLWALHSVEKFLAQKENTLFESLRPVSSRSKHKAGLFHPCKKRVNFITFMINLPIVIIRCMKLLGINKPFQAHREINTEGHSNECHLEGSLICIAVEILQFYIS